ncbi:hypothetical protein M378DRAFT_201055 [Amanita muscaria Koide BX008]|uniref:Tyr recombinase domain-containing protein n=1 Tax=Amanita muscaria (strain Koide BX008) TaxID=946122 RepID=A0A0C2S067_AMAMK|nr:hypothetical protein M378DRAFT_201055 [Amanita muscaria Koide BX008]
MNHATGGHTVPLLRLQSLIHSDTTLTSLMDVSHYVRQLMDSHPGSSRFSSNSSAGSHRNSRNTWRTLACPYPQPIPGPSYLARTSSSTPRQATSYTSAGDLADNLPAQVGAAVALAWAPATRQRYDVSIQEFTQFCDNQRVPEEERLPASEMLLALFAASMVGEIAGATISGKIHALRAWHIRNNKQWKGAVLLQHVLKGAANARLGAGIQTRRMPITLEMLVELHDGLDLAEHLDAAVFAVATMAFYGQMRMGELCASKEAYTVFNRATTPGYHHLQAPHTPAGSRMLLLPWTKVKRAKGEEVAICRQAGVTDPITALNRHMQINEINHADTALASYCSIRGPRKLLTISRFIKRCNEIWQAKGRQRYTAHCFRIGGTTHYLLHGVNPDVVRMMGRWSSDAFMRYWRQLDVVATVHTELLHGRSRI